VFGLLDLKIEEIGPFLGQSLKKCIYVDHRLSLALCQSGRECPKILKIWQTTNFDMGFQKKDIRSRSEKVDISNRRFSRDSPLKF
jgi:hypothetical protein